MKNDMVHMINQMDDSSEEKVKDMWRTIVITPYARALDFPSFVVSFYTKEASLFCAFFL